MNDTIGAVIGIAVVVFLWNYGRKPETKPGELAEIEVIAKERSDAFRLGLYGSGE